jgi:hypothetical protein
MLLRINETSVVNLRAYKNMQLSGPNANGLYSIDWWRFGESPLSLEVAKDRAVAQKVFNRIVADWAGEVRLVDWVDVLGTLFVRVKMPRCWREVEFSLRDVEPRFLVRRDDGDRLVRGGTDARLLSSKQMQELIVAMKTATAWPPNDDAMWASCLTDEGEVDYDNIGSAVTKKQRAELVLTFHAAIGDSAEELTIWDGDSDF